MGRRWSAPDFGLAGLAALWVGTSGGSKADQRRCKLRFSLAVRSWIGAGLTVGGFVFEGTVSSAANRNRLLWSVVARHHLPLRRRCLLGRAVLAGSGCRTKVKRASWLRCEKQESGVEPPHSKGPPVERPFGVHTGSNDYREAVADQSPGSRSAPWVERSPPSKPQRGFTIRPSGRVSCVEPRWGKYRCISFQVLVGRNVIPSRTVWQTVLHGN